MTLFHLFGRSFLQTSTRLGIALALICLPALLTAQYSESQALSPMPQAFEPDDVPAHIAIVDGAVTVEREGRVDEAVENDAMLAGDRLRTERGRAEILFADGSALDVDQYSTVDLLSDSLMRLLAGRVRLSLSRPSPASPGSDVSLDYRVDAAPASVLIRTAGEYRLELSDPRGGSSELDLAVLRGAAELQNAFGRTLVRAGTHARATERSEPSLPYAFNSAAWDPFDRWAEDQRAARFGVSSSRYLPAELRYYGGALDRSGAWAYEPAYGYVWYPRVDPFWRPYYAGNWSFVARIGWLWIGTDRWSWPTHHYGRWGVNANRWFWIPERRWSPAWVSWAMAPGYVSWCPIGFDGLPVISIANFAYRPGWTVLPSRVFTPNVVVRRYVVEARDLSPFARNALSVRTNAPALVQGYQGVRSAPPLRAPSAVRGGIRTAPSDPRRGVAVPRGEAIPRNAPAPPSSPAQSYGATRPESAAPSRSAAPGRYAPGSAPTTVGRPANDPPREPPQSGWRRGPGPSRVDPVPPPADSGRPQTGPRGPGSERGPSRAEPRNEPRGPGRAESAPPPDRPPAAEPAPSGRSRPPDAPSENRAVPRRGRGGST